MVVAVAALLLGGCGSGARQTPSAAEQVPRLGVLLDRIDGELAAHRYAEARHDLRAMKAEVARARGTGDLRATDAGLVLAAVDHLLSGLPSSATTGPTAGPTTSTTRPSPSASSKPARPRTTATPHASPSASPSPTQAPTTATPSSPTPTSSPSVQVSPAAATSSATP
ncbi:hypothetical protein EFL26_23380 [Nocardioides pocheonensis]|uniref:Uncharacterized protein n=1 Tax=Nocardioides pocheonensis TaxID=661485 RepID=A0A3N0GF54_9ACTN|nr:hypothetical protein EFL26_23380 [Nocardioides pocheonensis]